MARLGDVEEQYDGLKHCHSETEMALVNTQATLHDRKTFCRQLQDDCDSMSERISGWATDQK